MSATQTLLTVAEYNQLPEEEWPKYELSEGELVPRYGDEMSARLGHHRVRDKIMTRLNVFLETNGVGITVAEMDFRLAEDIVRRPDVSFVSNDRSYILDDDPTIVPGAPDLAIEVVSPSNRLDDMELKVDQLLNAGCQAVWLIHRATNKAFVCTPTARTLVRLDGLLEAAELLPGFKLPLSEILPQA